RSSLRRSRWRIPSDRKSSPFWQNLSESCSISAIRNVVISSCRSHSKNRNWSSRGSSNFAITSRTGRESMTRTPMSIVLSRLSTYILNTSSHDLFESCFSFFRISPRSRTLSFDSRPFGSIPRPDMFSRRLSRDCSRVTYTQPIPSFFALLNTMLNATEDFIVPGFPAIRTTCPFGTPPWSCSSSPRMYVRTRGDGMGSSVGCGRLEIKILARFPGRGTSSRRRAGLGAHDPEDAADDYEDGVKEAPDVQDEDQDADDDREESARAHPALVDEQAAEERGDRDEDSD